MKPATEFDRIFRCLALKICRNPDIIFFADFAESTTEWYFWLITLNSIVNPWVYIALNQDLRISLCKCCFPCITWTSNEKPYVSTTTMNQNQAMPSNTLTSSTRTLISLRPRSYTTSQVQNVAKLRMSTLKRRPYPNKGRRASAYFREADDIPMRCRINTFQLWACMYCRWYYL